jgi:ketosteroid isomerase-like protein
MPETKTVEAFAALVEAGEYLAAIERFYAPDVAMFENLQGLPGGRDALAGRERATLAAFQAIKGQRTRPILCDGDQAAIHWRFEMIPREGQTRVFEEIALQTWRGEQIVEERFFYDPAQLRER